MGTRLVKIRGLQRGCKNRNIKGGCTRLFVFARVCLGLLAFSPLAFDRVCQRLLAFACPLCCAPSA